MITARCSMRASRRPPRESRPTIDSGVRRLLIAGLLAALLAAVTQIAAGAAPSSVAPWAGSGPGTVTVTNDGTTGPAQMTYSLRSTSAYSRQTWTFSTTASGGPRTLRYDYKGFHAYYQVTVFLDDFVTHGGATTTRPLVSAGPVNCCTPPSGGFEYKGSVTLSVQPGDTYGFRFGGSNFDSNDILSGTLTVDTVATSKDQCMDDGWKAVTDQNGTPFKNEGDCVSYVSTGGRNPAGG